MRIIAGDLKGSTLYMPKNKKTRPLKDMAKESIFNLLCHSNKFSFEFEKSCILDIYAGIGSFGLECISRKARDVHFVEKEKYVVKILKKNIDKLKIKNNFKIYENDIFALLKKKNIFKLKFDLIFCDPPFENKDIKKLIELILSKNLLNKNGIVVIHRNRNSEDKFPSFFKIVDERIYGISKLIFGTHLL